MSNHCERCCPNPRQPKPWTPPDKSWLEWESSNKGAPRIAPSVYWVMAAIAVVTIIAIVFQVMLS